MSRSNIPVKTSEGVLEIKARALGLAPRIRTALLLVDGVKSAAELERLMAAAGVTPGALQLLIDKGLIRFQEELQLSSSILEESSQQDVSEAPDLHASIAMQDEASDTSHEIEQPVVPPVSQQPVKLDQKPAASKEAPKTPPAQPKVKQDPEPTVPLIPEPRKAAAKPTQPKVEPRVELDMFPEFVVEVSKPEPVVEDDLGPALEVATLIELESILGDVTKAEMDTILGVATQLELTPTQAMAPKTAVQAPAAPGRLPPLAQAEYDFKMSAAAVQKPVIPAAVLRMNLTVARAHLANVLDLHLEIDGYALKQNVMGCDSREALEQLFRLVEGALMRKLDRPAVQRIMGVAQALLER